MSETWSNWFTVVAGFAAAFALLLTVWETGWRQRRQRQKDVADKVVAWAVYEAEPNGLESDIGGVVIVNASHEVALQVDIKTQKYEEDGSFTEDGTPGQRFGLIPPGTYYLPQSGKSWAAPALVDTSEGKYAVTRRLASGETGVVHLVPITDRPEPRRVHFMRYTIALDTWRRDANSVLARGATHSDWDEDFASSQSERLPSVVAPHQPNQSVQTLIERLFRHFAVEGSSPVPNAAAEARAEFHAWGVRSLRRTRNRGQGLRLFTGEGQTGSNFYISGGHDGTFPNDGMQAHDEQDKLVNRRLFPVAPQPVAHWDTHFEELVEAIHEGIRRAEVPTS